MCTAEKYFTGGFILILPSLHIVAPPGLNGSGLIRVFPAQLELDLHGSTDGLELDGNGASEAKKGKRVWRVF